MKEGGGIKIFVYFRAFINFIEFARVYKYQPVFIFRCKGKLTAD